MRWMSRLAFVLILLSLVAACGSGPVLTVTTTEDVPPDLTISMSDFRFGPAEIVVEAGEFTLRVRNDGTVVHEWALLRSPIETETDYRADLVIASLRLELGQVGTITLDVPPPGEYQIICPIPGHFSQGMIGSLRVNSQ